MNDHLRVHSALPCTDLDRARRFYDTTLDLTPTEKRPGGLRYELPGGTGFFLFPSPVTERAGHTQAGFEVDDLEERMTELSARGVVFEAYTGDAPTVDGVATRPDGTRAAWFKDSEGNLLVLVQFS